MIKYKRIYPLRQNGRLAAIVTIVGNNDSSDVFVKFKIRPKEQNLVLIMFNPKTYEYEMMPMEETMKISRPMTDLTACIIAARNGMFIEFLMEGSINKSRLNTSKLKSMIAMDMYTRDMGCNACEQKENIPPPEENNQELMDYLKQMDEGTLPASYASGSINESQMERLDEKENVPNIQAAKVEEQVEQTSFKEIASTNESIPQVQEQSSAVINKKEEIQTTQTLETNEGSCDKCVHIPVTEEIKKASIKTSTNNITVVSTDIPENIDIPKEIEQARGKYCDFVNPFKNRWDGVWWKVQYPDKNWHYIVGRVVVDGSNVSVLGVPGERNTKPVCLESCDMYAVADNGIGYWLMFQK